MTAPTKNYTAIADTDIDVGSPLKQELMTAIRDNDVNAHEWIGGSYTPAIDHNHDGTNSALIEIGPNYLRNGSFESSTTGWALTPFTGGTITTNNTNEMDGQNCLAITSTVLANGGGEALSTTFVAISQRALYSVRACIKAGSANVSSKIEVVWYDDTQAQISVSTIYSDSATNTTAAIRGSAVQSPTNAKFAKIKLTGGVPATGSAVGTVYFDGVIFFAGHNLHCDTGSTYTLASSAGVTSGGSGTYAKIKEIYLPFGGYLSISHESRNNTTASGATKIYLNGVATGAEFALTTSFVAHNESIYVAQGDLVQVYGHTGGAGTVEVQNFTIKTASLPPILFVLI